MKKTLLFLLLFVITANIFSQNVNIPDANFKAYLVGNSAINTNADTEIQVSEATAFTGGVICLSQSITDLTGIENFVNITVLNVQDNQLTSLDVSQNTALEALNCAQNNISVFNFNQNTTLQELYCNQNNLSALDLSQLTGIISFNCSQNSISSLDFSQNIGINQNTSLTIPYINCQQNNLTVLNMKNISPTILTGAYFNASSNPNLTCIDVDDVAAATTSWTNIDLASSFSTDCAALGISDFELANGITILNTPNAIAISYSNTIRFQNHTVYSISGAKVTTGKERNINTTFLASGIYILKLDFDKGTVVTKVVIN